MSREAWQATSPWGGKELDTTEWLTLSLHFTFRSIADKNYGKNPKLWTTFYYQHSERWQKFSWQWLEAWIAWILQRGDEKHSEKVIKMNI